MGHRPGMDKCQWPGHANPVIDAVPGPCVTHDYNVAGVQYAPPGMHIDPFMMVLIT